jgi:hypothetical protein
MLGRPTLLRWPTLSVPRTNSSYVWVRGQPPLANLVSVAVSSRTPSLLSSRNGNGAVGAAAAAVKLAVGGGSRIGAAVAYDVASGVVVAKVAGLVVER